MSALDDIEASVLDRIASLETGSTAAIEALNDYMATLQNLAYLIPPYFTPNEAKYSGTTATFSKVEKPDFDQLEKADDAIEGIDPAVQSVANLDIQTGTLLADLQEKFDDASADLQAIKEDTDELYGEHYPQITPDQKDFGFIEGDYSSNVIDTISDTLRESLIAHLDYNKRSDIRTSVISSINASIARAQGKSDAASAVGKVDYRAEEEIDLLNAQLSLIQSAQSSDSDTTHGVTSTELGYHGNDRARREASNQKEINDVMSEFSGRGFPDFPQYILDDARSYITGKQQIDDEDAEREITIQHYTLVLENQARAIEATSRYHQVLMAWHEAKIDRAFKVANILFKLGQEMANLLLTVLNSQADEQKRNMDIAKDSQAMIIEEFKSNTQRFIQRIDAILSRADGYLNAASAEGQVYAMLARVSGKTFEFDLAENETNIKTLLWNIDNFLKAADENLRSFEQIASIRLRAATAGAEMQLALVAAARNSITTVASLVTGEKVEGQE
jgi:hypothetical protein